MKYDVVKNSKTLKTQQNTDFTFKYKDGMLLSIVL